MQYPIKNNVDGGSSHENQHDEHSPKAKGAAGSKKYSNYMMSIARSRLSVGKLNFGCSIACDLSYAYIEVPKAASTSILNLLQHREDPVAAASMKHEHVRVDSPLKQLIHLDEHEQRQVLAGPDCTRFTFVRNPYTRLLSAYLSKINKPSAAKRQYLSDLHSKPIAELSDLNEKVEFSDFVDVVCSQDPCDMNSHWRLQVFQSLNDRINYDFIGKFESLNADFKKISEKIFPGEDLQIVRTSKVNTNSGDRMSEYYSEELKSMVYDKFYDDFQAFGYER